MKRIATLVAGIALMLPAPALAASSSTCQAYNPQLCQPGTTTTPTNLSSGTLPFTGLDVVLLLAGGGMLIATGTIVRRLARRTN